MSMVVLIGLLLIGGVIAWWTERINSDWPRWVALATVCAAAALPVANYSKLVLGELRAGPRPARWS